MHIIEGGYDDRPLSGPWSRRREEQAPPERNLPHPADGGENETGIETGDWTLPGPGSRGGDLSPETLKEGPEKAAYGTAAVSEQPAADFEEANSGGREDPDTCRKPHPDLFCPDGENRRQRFTLRQFFSPSGLYAGIIMAEVLQSRGGRSGRR